MSNQQSDEKLTLVKQYKLSPQKIDYLYDKLSNITNKTVVYETNPEGRPFISTETLLERVSDLLTVIAEMNLDLMKNAIAVHIEHDLEREIQVTEMHEKISDVFKKMGVDEKTFRNMFGGHD